MAVRSLANKQLIATTEIEYLRGMVHSIKTMVVMCLILLSMSARAVTTPHSVPSPKQAAPVQPPNGASTSADTGSFYPLAEVDRCWSGSNFTVGHKILCMESAAGTVTPEMYKRLDAVIDQASLRIESVALDRQTAPGAEGVLKQIDAALTAENFIYPSWDYVGTLSEGLTPVELDEKGVSEAIATYENVNRKEHIKRRGPDVYYVADCDTLSFIYLAVGDRLKLPIRILERTSKSDDDPGHNFVRWDLPKGESVDWETMTGDKRPSTEGAYVLTDAQLSGYLHLMLGNLWRRAWSPRRAITAYRAALAHGYHSSAALNELAWLLSTNPDPAERDSAAAMLYAKQLCSDDPTPNEIDTCAAAAARGGEFDQAVSMQMKAIERTSGEATKSRMRERLALYRTKRPYTQSRIREQRALDACDDSGDLFRVSPGSQCPDPSKYHYYRDRK